MQACKIVILRVHSKSETNFTAPEVFKNILNTTLLVSVSQNINDEFKVNMHVSFWPLQHHYR